MADVWQESERSHLAEVRSSVEFGRAVARAVGCEMPLTDVAENGQKGEGRAVGDAL